MKAKGNNSHPRGLSYPVDFVAAELGVDRRTLLRRCEEIGSPVNGKGLTFARAYDALSRKSESEDARKRKQIAEAEAAELETKHRRGEFCFLETHANMIRDFAVQVRVSILERASWLTKDQKRKTIALLAEIKPGIADPSNKKK